MERTTYRVELRSTQSHPEVNRTPLERPERPKEPDKLNEVREYLLHGQKLLALGDYEGSLQVCQKVLSLFSNRPPGDEALFNMGLIYAHAKNPKKDYGKSLQFFERLMKDFPESQWVEQARVWTGVMRDNRKLYQVIEKSKEVDFEIERKKRSR